MLKTRDGQSVRRFINPLFFLYKTVGYALASHVLYYLRVWGLKFCTHLIKQKEVLCIHIVTTNNVESHLRCEDDK
jgi:hypothetical protein